MPDELQTIAPPKIKPQPIVDKNITSVANLGNRDILDIVEHPELNNAEKIEKLQAAIIVKRDKLGSLKQKAAQSRIIEFITEANQYLAILKNEVDVEGEDDDVDMDVFQIIEYNAKLVALKKSNALIITGDAGVGKTHSVKEAIAFLNPHKKEEDNDENQTEDADAEVIEETVNHTFSSTNQTVEIEEVEEEFSEDDDIEIVEGEEEEEEETLTSIDAPKLKTGVKNSSSKVSSRNHEDSGYYIASGSCTAAALYELLFIHRHKLLIFDDFDSIFKDADAVNYLKAALDTYTIREVSKMTAGNSFNSLGMSDEDMFDEYELSGKVPNQFRFFGNIIFISNIHEDKFDKALISRALHVEVRLTKEQMIERMESLMIDIRPNVDITWKMEALEYLEFLTNNYICKFDLNLRELIHFIDLKAGYPDEIITLNGKQIPVWKQLAKKRLVKARVKI